MANKKFECEICKTTMSDQTSYDNHLLGSKHQLTLHKKIVNEKKEKCGIYVTGFQPNVKKEEVIDLFTKYGKIVDHFMSSNKTNIFIIMQFDNEETAKKLLTITVHFQGRRLFIRPRILKEPQKEEKKQEEYDLHPIVMDILQNNPTLDIQLPKMLDAIALSQRTIHNIYQMLCTDIQRILSEKFPNCRVWPFGSTVSSLGFRSSDIDLYIEVVYHPQVPPPCESLPVAYTKLTRSLLQKSRLFSNVVAIPHAKTPIVKLFHVPTRVRCDLNFKNMLGVCNSELIRYLISFDVRIRPLMMIIKFWGKVHELTGSGKMSNYGLIMLVVFFLQQQPHPILIPILTLQTIDSCSFHEGWNGGFSKSPALVPRFNSNNFSIPQLLHKFFQFFSIFDYGFNVICPLNGKYYSKSDFVTGETLPKEFFHYRRMLQSVETLSTNCAICIQDPFELNHNITKIVSAKLLEDFQKLCEYSANICSEMSTSNYNNLLTKLFEKDPIALYKNITATDNKCLFKISIGTTLTYLDNTEEAEENKERALRRLWFDKINQFLVSILVKVFMFDITVKKQLPRSKSQKLEGQSDIHDKNIDSISFYCKGYTNVWDARKSISKNINHIDNFDAEIFLEREIAISDYILNVLCKGIQIKDPLVDFNLTFNSKINPTEAEFLLENLQSRKNCFRQMANYFSNRLPIWFEKYLKESKYIQSKNSKEIQNKTTESINTTEVNTTASINTTEVNTTESVNIDIIVIKDDEDEEKQNRTTESINKTEVNTTESVNTTEVNTEIIVIEDDKI